MKPESELEKIFARIPSGLDVLVTHGPARNLLDRTDRGAHAGSQALLERICVVEPRVHIFGHIHEARGDTQTLQTRHHNVASLDEWYNPQGDAVVIDI